MLVCQSRKKLAQSRGLYYEAAWTEPGSGGIASQTNFCLTFVLFLLVTIFTASVIYNAMSGLCSRICYQRLQFYAKIWNFTSG